MTAPSASSNRRIALFLHTLGGGGAERVTLTLADSLLQRGFPVDLVLGRLTGALVPEVPEGARVVELHAGRVLTCIPGLARYLRRERPAVLLSALEHANLAALWAHRLSGTSVRTVVAVHSTVSVTVAQSTRWRDTLLLRLAGIFYRSADAIVAVSKGAADDLAATTGLPRERIRVIYNPVITEAMLAKAREAPAHPWLADAGPPVVLAVANLSVAKDYQTLIRAFSRLRNERDVRLLILGEGPERSDLEALVAELDLGAFVSMPGYAANPYSCMSRAAVFALSSRFEALPTSLIEAMGCGLPVVSTDCKSGPREILENGAHGRLVAVGDSDALAAAIAATLDDPRPAAQLRARADRFRPERVVDEYLAVLLPEAHTS